jgi:hypothetical protein
MKSLEIVNKLINQSKRGMLIDNNEEELETIKQDLEILELVRGKSFFFHLSKQELKKVNKWLEENH